MHTPYLRLDLSWTAMLELLDSEKSVFYSLAQDASRTDAQIGELVGLKKGTVSSVRRRLMEADLLKFVAVPAFNKLGCELFAYQTGSTNPVESDVKASQYVEYAKKTPQIFFGVVGIEAFITFSVHRDLEDYEDMVLAYSNYFTGSKKEYRAKTRRTIFPYSHTRGTFIPNFSRLLHDHLKIKSGKPVDVGLSRAEVETPDFTDIEKRVLVLLVENPNASDRVVASMAKVSRQAVTRIRNRFEKERVFVRVCFPRLDRLGFELFLSAHSRFVLDVPWEKRLQNQPGIVVNRSFYTLTKATEGVGNYMFSKYADFSDGLDDVMEWYTKEGVIDEAPDLLLFPVERLTPLRMFDYGPAVRYLLMG